MCDDVRVGPSTEAEVEELVRATARREGFAPPLVQWTDGAPAVTRPGGTVIVLRRTMLRDPEEARFVALHELGHVAQGHQRTGPAGVVAATLLLIAVGPIAIGFLLAWWLGVPVEWGLVLGVWVAAVLLAIAARRQLHAREYAADRWAAEHGGVLTEEIARAAYGDPRPWVQHFGALWSTYPPTVSRVHCVSSALSAGEPSA